MKFDELELMLSNEELEAIQALESNGWQVLTETKIEDTRKKDGGRIRTFTLTGRYDLAVVLKHVGGKETVAESNGVLPPTSGDSSNLLGDSSDPEETGAPGTKDLKGSGDFFNFWENQKNWQRKSGKILHRLVTKDERESLLIAPQNIVDLVKEKFDRLCDPDDWIF